jgi:hypothetical protein
MNEFIEKNRRLLGIYCIAARIIGWCILLVAAIMIIAEILSGGRFIGAKGVDRLYMLEGLLFRYMLPAFLALLVAQFIRYLYEVEHQPGWILRYGDKILYVYAVIVVLNSIWQHVYYIIVRYSDFGKFGISKFFYVVLAVLLTGAKALILVGFAQILRRIMPVIEESKTLV